LKKYSVSEFTNEIRNKYPKAYNDLSDKKLLELWIKKFPNDIKQIKDYNNSNFKGDNAVREIYTYYIKWLGIIICALCIFSFFVSTNWIITLIKETNQEYGRTDSDASKFLYTIGIYIAEFGYWLKKLPIILKIIGTVVGGIIWLTHNED